MPKVMIVRCTGRERAAPRLPQARRRRLLCGSAAHPPRLSPYPSPRAGIEVCFMLPYRCKFGQRLCVIGASDNLGAWDVSKAIPMEWTDGDVWMVNMQIPAE